MSASALATATLAALFASIACNAVFEQDLLELAVGGDWWFDHLYGISHRYAKSLGRLATGGNHFAALPSARYFALLLFSSWSVPCRRAISEFDRLAEVLHAGGVADLVPMTLDCSWSGNRDVCALFLGSPELVLPLRLDRVNAPRIGELAYNAISDPWPRKSLPVLAVATREDLLDLGSGHGARSRVTQISPVPETAEEMFTWITRVRIDAIGTVDLHNMHFAPARLVPEDALRPSAPQHVNGEDVEAGLALWLHEIFSRHTFELPHDDPMQARRSGLVDFLRLLCSYFPEHLEGSSLGSECRTSLCHLGGIMENDDWWHKYTEVVDVSIEVVQAGELDSLADPHPTGSPSVHRYARVYRVRWTKLERDWQLCGRPWVDRARTGWVLCRAATEPLSRGLPCGVWGLLHAVVAEVARVHDCAFAPEEDVDRCVGPPENATAADLQTLRRTRYAERGAAALALQQRRKKNATLPASFKLSVGKGKSTQCIKVLNPDALVNETRATNATAELLLIRPLERDKVLCVLAALDGHKDDAVVEIQFVDDFVREDGGALVARVIKGPHEFRRAADESWKLQTIDGVWVSNHSDRGWHEMLQTSRPYVRMVIEGPAPCHRSSLCETPCTEFGFELNSDSSTLEAPVGILRQNSSQHCLSRLSTTSWYFWHYDAGLGTTKCDEEPSLYRQFKHVFLGNVTFCNIKEPYDCVRIYEDLNFTSDREFVPVATGPPEVQARAQQPRIVVEQLRQVVALFWRCAECRRRFLAIDADAVPLIHSPRDAVLWWWGVHNTVTSTIKTSEDCALEFPCDPDRVESPSWPPPALCPQCRQHHDEFGGGSAERRKLVQSPHAPCDDHHVGVTRDGDACTDGHGHGHRGDAHRHHKGRNAHRGEANHVVGSSTNANRSDNHDAAKPSEDHNESANAVRGSGKDDARQGNTHHGKRGIKHVANHTDDPSRDKHEKEGSVGLSALGGKDVEATFDYNEVYRFLVGTFYVSASRGRGNREDRGGASQPHQFSGAIKGKQQDWTLLHVFIGRASEQMGMRENVRYRHCMALCLGVCAAVAAAAAALTALRPCDSSLCQRQRAMAGGRREVDLTRLLATAPPSMVQAVDVGVYAPCAAWPPAGSLSPKATAL